MRNLDTIATGILLNVERVFSGFSINSNRAAAINDCGLSEVMMFRNTRCTFKCVKSLVLCDSPNRVRQAQIAGEPSFRSKIEQIATRRLGPETSWAPHIPGGNAARDVWCLPEVSCFGCRRRCSTGRRRYFVPPARWNPASQRSGCSARLPCWWRRPG